LNDLVNEVSQKWLLINRLVVVRNGIIEGQFVFAEVEPLRAGVGTPSSEIAMRETMPLCGK
jgi:hypothetical protein